MHAIVQARLRPRLDGFRHLFTSTLDSVQLHTKLLHLRLGHRRYFLRFDVKVFLHRFVIDLVVIHRPETFSLAQFRGLLLCPRFVVVVVVVIYLSFCFDRVFRQNIRSFSFISFGFVFGRLASA